MSAHTKTILAVLTTIAVFIGFSVPVSTEKHVVLHVDDGAAPGGNGSGGSPYNTVEAALEAARATSGSVAINVAPGDYVISRSLVIDRSLELRGSSVLDEDSDGLPTGDVAAGTETRIVAAAELGLQPLILVGRADATVLDGVSIRGFVLEGRPGGIELLVTRVQQYLVAGNVFRAPAFIGLQSVASSGSATGNHFSGVDVGASLNGGYAASPSNVVFTDNRSVRNINGGLLLIGASINIPELGDELDAVVRNNDLSDNSTSFFSFGLRLFILRRDRGAPGDSQFSSRTRAVVRDNRIVGNSIGIAIDAGFPYRRVGTTCDPRVFTGAIDLTLAGNRLAASLRTASLVTFTRLQTALNPPSASQWQYLHEATFAISDPDGTMADAWIDHPATDPVVGPCPGDATHEPLGNVLVYNDAVVPNGRNF